MKHAPTLLSVMLVAATLAGCGGSNSTSTSTDSGANFVARANQICATVNSKIAAMPAINTPAEVIKSLPQEVAVITGAVAQLKALTPPADHKTTAEQLISGLGQEGTLLQQIIAALKAADAAKLKTLANQETSLNKTDGARAKTLGLTECTKNVEAGSAKGTASGSG
jgi:hypothetical protein